MLTIRQKLGRQECPYLERWVLDLKLFSIRLHHWISGDDPRYFHDHPWWFWVFVLKGGYNDVTPVGTTRMNRFTLSFRPALHKHTVQVDRGDCWTLLLTGPESRPWGFYTFNKHGKEIWLKAKRYFIKHGHHPCQNPKEIQMETD